MTHQTELRREIAKSLADVLSTKNLTIAEAARDLGVSRQMMHRYLNAKATPGMEVIFLACHLWNMTVLFRGFRAGAIDFVSPRKKKGMHTVPILPFDRVRPEDLSVTVKNQTLNSIELRVSVKLPPNSSEQI